MFDFAGSELLLIAVVALVLIGPKDLPVAIKAVSQAIKKARRMAGEFQGHVDEMMRDADLKDVRDSVNELRRMDIKGKILRAVDEDGSIRSSLKEPIADFSPPPPPVPVHDIAPALAADIEATREAAASEPVPPAPVFAEPLRPAPAFVPPNYQPKPPRPRAPAFIPPAAAALAEHA